MRAASTARTRLRSVGHTLVETLRSPPVASFLVVYFFSCYIGAIALLGGPDWVRERYVYNSGADIGRLSTEQVVTALAIVHVAPLLLFAGWAAAIRLVSGVSRRPTADRTHRRLLLPATIGFIAVVTYLVARLAAAGAISNLGSWLDSSELLDQRADVMETLSFFEFILAYSVAPLLAGIVCALRLADGAPPRRLFFELGSIAAGLLLVNLLLFQKRPLIVALIIALSLVVFYPPSRERLRPSRTGRRTMIAWGVGVVATLYAVYLVLLVGPVIGDTTAETDDGAAPVVDASFDRGPQGWASSGPHVPAGSRLRTIPNGHEGAGLEILPTRPRQGASYATDLAGVAGTRWELTAWLRGPRPSVVQLALGANPPDRSSTAHTIGPRWSRVRLVWTQARDVAGIFIQIRSLDGQPVAVDSVQLRRTAPSGGRVAEARDLVPLRSLAGSAPAASPTETESTARRETGPAIVAASFDSGATGWLSAGPFTLEGASVGSTSGRLAGSAAEVEADRPLEGVNYAVGPVRGQDVFTLDAWTRAEEPTELEFLLGEPGNAVTRRVRVGQRWRSVSIAWEGGGATVRPTIGVRATSPARFSLDEVELYRLHPGVAAKPGAGADGGVEFPRLQEVTADSEGEGLVFHVLLAPFTRTAGPAVAYPWIYPSRHGYYDVDVGLDVLGIGESPDDNRTSFKEMFPTAGEGVNSVPYMFTLYSQGGVWIALVGSLLVGVVWGALWVLSRRLLDDPLLGAIASSLLVVLGVFIAGDSARNAVLASYGILWPALFAAAVTFALAVRRRWSQS